MIIIDFLIESHHSPGLPELTTGIKPKVIFLLSQLNPVVASVSHHTLPVMKYYLHTVLAEFVITPKNKYNLNKNSNNYHTQKSCNKTKPTPVTTPDAETAGSKSGLPMDNLLRPCLGPESQAAVHA